MDPAHLTSAASVVSAVCAVVGAVTSAQRIINAKSNQSRAEDEAQNTGPATSGFELAVRVNCVMSTFGRQGLDGK